MNKCLLAYFYLSWWCLCWLFVWSCSECRRVSLPIMVKTIRLICFFCWT